MRRLAAGEKRLAWGSTSIKNKYRSLGKYNNKTEDSLDQFLKNETIRSVYKTKHVNSVFAVVFVPVLDIHFREEKHDSTIYFL
jgi:hypothetical protein